MDRTMHCALVLLSILGSLEGFVQRDMAKDVFVFQRDTKSTHVDLQLKKNATLRSFTLCFRTYTDKAWPYGLFELVTHPPFYSEITGFKSSATSYILTVGADRVEFNAQDKINQWLNLCFSWESATGTAHLWVDGKRLPRLGLQRGYAMKRSVSFKLGKRRTSSPYINQYVGEISDVYMWDYVLSLEEIRQERGAYSQLSTGNLLSWRDLTYDLVDDVVVEPV
ncbi:serum amyloid P-component-like isoform X1 [Lissotriton helveticus]